MSRSERGRGHECLFMCVCWTLTDCSGITIDPLDAFIFPVTFKLSFQIYSCYPPPTTHAHHKRKNLRSVAEKLQTYSVIFSQLGEMIRHNVVLIYVTLVSQNTEHLGDKIHFCEKWPPKSFPCLLHDQISVLPLVIESEMWHSLLTDSTYPLSVSGNQFLLMTVASKVILNTEITLNIFNKSVVACICTEFIKFSFCWHCRKYWNLMLYLSLRS